MICVEARKAWQRTYDVKRKASEAQENLFSHSERTRKISKEHAGVEAHVNDGIGSLGQAVRAAAKATYFLTCGVPDRESLESGSVIEPNEEPAEIESLEWLYALEHDGEEAMASLTDALVRLLLDSDQGVSLFS